MGREVSIERCRHTERNCSDGYHVVLRILSMLCLLGGSSASRLYGIEKDWFAHEAQVIVVGTFKPNPTYPWFDGWHLTGTINVSDVLYGPRMPHQISIKLVCEWRTCQWWPRPSYPSDALAQGLWFLRRIDENSWESSLSGFDLGFRFLSDRSYWEEYIRKHKIHPWPGFRSKTSTY